MFSLVSSKFLAMRNIVLYSVFVKKNMCATYLKDQSFCQKPRDCRLDNTDEKRPKLRATSSYQRSKTNQHLAKVLRRLPGLLPRIPIDLHGSKNRLQNVWKNQQNKIEQFVCLIDCAKIKIWPNFQMVILLILC